MALSIRRRREAAYSTAKARSRYAAVRELALMESLGVGIDLVAQVTEPPGFGSEFH